MGELGADGASAPTPASLGCGGPRGLPAGPEPPVPAPGVESDAQLRRALGADGAATMARRPRPQDGAAWVPLDGDLGERPGRVTPNVGACPPGRGGRTFGAGGGGCGTAGRARRRRGRGGAASPSRDDLQAEGLGRTARLARRPASRRGSRARRHRRSRRCARRRVGGHGPRPAGAVREDAPQGLRSALLAQPPITPRISGSGTRGAQAFREGGDGRPESGRPLDLGARLLRTRSWYARTRCSRGERRAGDGGCLTAHALLISRQ